MLPTIFREFTRWFRLSIDAILTPDIPWQYRWRMLALQPITLLTTALHTIPYLLPGKRPFRVEYITVDTGVTLRILVFEPPPSETPKHFTEDNNDSHTGETPHNGSRAAVRPLHLDIHGGSFIGGQPEEGAPFCRRVAAETGAVVVSTTYRFAPRYPFPAAIDDVDAVVRFLKQHARKKWRADPESMTVSGWSAGGNLALAAGQNMKSEGEMFRCGVLFYAALDLKLSPAQKPKPKSMGTDPMAWLYPLFDGYPAPTRATHRDDPRLNPCKAKLQTLPRNMLLVVPHIDPLVKEQLEFAERVKQDISHADEQDRDREIEVLYVEDPKAFHGYLNLPVWIVGRHLHDQAFNAGVSLISKVHAQHRQTSVNAQ